MKHYNVSELNLNNASEEEQIRTRTIFEDLREKAKNNELLLEREKDFLCMCLKISDWNDGKREDFLACENELFPKLKNHLRQMEFNFLQVLKLHNLFK